MRKALFILLTICFAFSCFAQEHLSFKGIPITGSMTEFCKSLTQKGFTKIRTQDNATIFSGDFTGKSATIVVWATDNGKTVLSLAVFFDACEEWNLLTNTYDYYKELYSRKYGNPNFCKESNPANLDTNTSLMYELSQGTVVWASQWQPTGGSIELAIEKANGYLQGWVVIRYHDTLNVEEKIQRDLDEI